MKIPLVNKLAYPAIMTSLSPPLAVGGEGLEIQRQSRDSMQQRLLSPLPAVVS